MKCLRLASILALSLACAATPGMRPEPDAAGDPEPDAAPLPHDARPRADTAAADTAADTAPTADGHRADGPAPDADMTSFAVVQAIFNLSCIRCHDAVVTPRPEGFSYPMLPLTTGVARANLVNKTGAEKCGGVLVKPGDPAHSYLIQKLTENPPCDGKRMPSPGMLAQAPPLPDDQIAIIRAWIAAGAPP